MRTILPKDAILIPPEAKRVFKGIIFEVYQWPQKMYDGSTAIFERIKRPDTVRIIAIKDGRIVTVRDEQPARKALLTLPGGRHDVEQETELDCAKRELLEETGFSFKNWRLIEAVQPARKIEYMVYTFVAMDFIASEAPKRESGERISVELMPLERLKEIVKKDQRNWPAEIILNCATIFELADWPELNS